MGKRNLKYLGLLLIFLNSSCVSKYHKLDIDASELPPSNRSVSLKKKSVLDFVNKFTSPQPIKLNSEDRAILARIDSYKKDSLEEAAIVLGKIHTWFSQNRIANSLLLKKRLNRSQTARSLPGDITGVKVGPSESIEKMFQSADIDLPNTLATNKHLKHLPIQVLVFKALKRSQSSENFIIAVKKVVRANIELAGKDLETFQMNVNSLGEKKLNLNVFRLEEEEFGIEPQMTLEEDLLEQDEEVFLEAQELVNKQAFKQAKSKLLTISKESLYYETSIEKIRTISNLAVQNLRRKAAKAFQSAKPIADRKTRAAYLAQAQDYLLDAITNFPDSDQIRTVRENLDVIKRSLEAVIDKDQEVKGSES